MLRGTARAHILARSLAGVGFLPATPQQSGQETRRSRPHAECQTSWPVTAELLDVSRACCQCRASCNLEKIPGIFPRMRWEEQLPSGPDATAVTMGHGQITCVQMYPASRADLSKVQPKGCGDGKQPLQQASACWRLSDSRWARAKLCRIWGCNGHPFAACRLPITLALPPCSRAAAELSWRVHPVPNLLGPCDVQNQVFDVGKAFAGTGINLRCASWSFIFKWMMASAGHLTGNCQKVHDSSVCPARPPSMTRCYHAEETPATSSSRHGLRVCVCPLYCTSCFRRHL